MLERVLPSTCCVPIEITVHKGREDRAYCVIAAIVRHVGDGWRLIKKNRDMNFDAASECGNELPIREMRNAKVNGCAMLQG